MQLSKEEIVELGQYCEELMSNPLFNKLVGLYETQTVHYLLNTEPEDKQKREDLYHSLSGVRDLAGLMSFFKSKKDEIINEDNAPSEDEPEDLDAQ